MPLLVGASGWLNSYLTLVGQSLALNKTLDYEVMRKVSMPQAEISLVSLLLSVFGV